MWFGLVATWTATDGSAGGGYGRSIDVGDTDGDGYDDVLVGAPLSDALGPRRGAAYLFRGSATGPSATPSWSARGEVDGSFGESVALCDVDGDRLAEVVVGAWSSDGYRGLVNVYRGTATGPSPTPDWVLSGARDLVRHGMEVGCAGDVDRDGDEEVLVSAPLTGPYGAVHLYEGDPGGLPADPSWSVVGTMAAYLTGRLRGVGDVDGDGFGDVAMSGTTTSSSAVFVFHGSADGLARVADTVLVGEHSFGEAVAGGVDVDADGFGDLLVGAPYAGTLGAPEGTASLHLGSPGGLDPAPAWEHRGPGPLAEAGLAVALAPDVDGDGASDALVGTPSDQSPLPGAGSVGLFLGSPAGLAETAVWEGAGAAAQARVGCSLATGDVNRDGLTDVVAGACQYAGLGVYDGAVVLYTATGDGDGDGARPPDDCAPDDPNVHPGASEVPYDGVDQDCDPATRDDDLDGDSFPVGDDCADDDPAIHPGADEVPYDGVDQDCDPATPDDDLDGDGLPRVGDCDDADPAVTTCEPDPTAPGPVAAGGGCGCASGGPGAWWAAWWALAAARRSRAARGARGAASPTTPAT